jgi:ferric-dicitrate binding protein FerR (iron transport regulator)
LKRQIGTWALTLSFAAGPLGCPAEPPPPRAAEAPQAARAQPRAVLAGFRGEVTVKRAAGQGWISAQAQMELYPNDKLRTADGASAEVRFPSGTVLTVGSDALVGLAESRAQPGQDDSDVTVLRGRVDADLSDAARESLTVSTPSATVRAGREIVFQ